MSNFWAGPSVTNCKFNNNSAIGGGGMHNDFCNPTVTNCTFTLNSGSLTGGGIYNWGSGPSVKNCTFSDNWSNYGGGMCNDFLSFPTVTNCILWGDMNNEIEDDWTSSPTVTYSDVQGGWGGTGNINANPLFADADGRLSWNSPCIDKGNNGAVSGVATDLDGNPRIVDGDLDGTPRVDMGAYEYEWPDDTDTDGIKDSVDTAPLVFSDDFDDGTTSGTILNRADQIVLVSDATDPLLGVKIEASTNGGAEPALVSVCDSATVALDAGDTVVATCGSVEITVVQGTVEIFFVADDGTEAQATLNAGDSIQFDPETLTFSVPATNTEDVVIFVDNTEIVLAPGESKMFIRASIDIDPDTLNLKSKGRWITCYIELPDGFDVGDINVATLMLNGEVPAQSHPTQVGDYDADGVADLMVKFDLAATQATVEIGDAVQITVAGELNDETVFEGSDTVRVIEPGN